MSLLPLIAALALAPTQAVPAVTATSEKAPANDRLDTLLRDIFRETMREQPEAMTALGLDAGPNLSVRSLLNDRSLAARDEARAASHRWAIALDAIDRDALSPRQRQNLDAVAYQLKLSDAASGRFGYGEPGYPAPYTVTQLDGAYRDVPTVLSEQQPLESTDDAEAYLARLAAFAKALDQQSLLVEREASIGAAPPDFVLARSLEQLEVLRARNNPSASLAATFAKRLEEAGLTGNWADRAKVIVSQEIEPALDRQIALLRRLSAQAPHDAGVWRLPDGDAYYDYALRYFSTTDLSSDQIHAIGTGQVADISRQLDALLRKQGLERGTVGERLAQLQRRADQIYPNDADGRAKLLQDLNAEVGRTTQSIAPYFGVDPHVPLDIRAVPEAIEAGAPGGYYNPPALDGSRGGIYFINLRDTAEWPKWRLPTLTHHEGVPGHHWQHAVAKTAPKLPPLRQIMGYAAYAEGWGLYAEQLADEAGVFDGNALGRIGYLQSLLFRSARLVVDTGIHRKRWSREKAIQYLVDTLGEAESKATTEVERYAVHPGQAVSYKIGHNKIVELRDRARRELGDRFDLASFHDAILLAGAMPLETLEGVVDDWIAARLKKGQ